MRRLVLVAAGGLAREVLAVEAVLGRYDEITLVDDDPALWGTSVHGARVVGGIETLGGEDRPDVLVCAGSGRSRRRLVERLDDLGVGPQRYARALHPGVELPTGCTVGAGSILLAGVVLTADVRVGDHVVAMPHVTLTHDDVVASYATLCAGVSLGGGVRVGEAAYLGMNSCVREGLAVGRDSVLGMGAALVRSLPAGETWAGVPASPVRARLGLGV